jgi:hypothetical protein
MSDRAKGLPGTDTDVAEAETAIERLESAPADPNFMLKEHWLLRLRALLTRVHDDKAAYRNLGDHYHDMAKMLDFQAHRAWAEATPQPQSFSTAANDYDSQN